MVPVYLWEEDPSRRIAVVQPQRLAAKSLAQFVGLQLGAEGVVGCASGDLADPPEARILYCTADWLLRYLTSTPSAAQRFSHIILDEVHERTLDQDLLVLLMRILLQLHKFKLVVMSAHLEHDLFSVHFAQILPELRPIIVEGRPHPVQTVFLDTLEALPDIRMKNVEVYLPAVQSVKMNFPGLTRPVGMVLLHVLRALASPGRCVLVFLPGVAEIEAIELGLRREPPRVKWEALPLHALQPEEEQDRVLQPVPPNKYRVVLASDLAGSGVTLPAAHYVIDSGLCRRPGHDPRTRQTASVLAWVAQSRAAQRAGRTGRLGPGVVIHLVPQEFFGRLEAEEEPEMSCLPLEQTIMRTMLRFRPFGSIRQLLSKTLAPPDDAEVWKTIKRLYRFGALYTDPQDPRVTSLGRLVACLPLELPLVRLVAVGHGLGLLPEAVAMAACLMQGDLFPMPSRLYIQNPATFSLVLATNFQERLQRDAGRYSEPLAALSLYQDWLARRQPSVSLSRAQTADMTAVAVCRALITSGILPLDDATRQRLTTLEALARGRGGGADAVADVFRWQRGPPLLMPVLLAAAASPTFLRFRIPKRQPVVKLAEDFGMDLQHTVVLKPTPDVFLDAGQVLHTVDYPQCRAQRVELVPADYGPALNALIELEPAPALAPVPAPGSVTPEVVDVGASAKLLMQMFHLCDRSLPALQPVLGQRRLLGKAILFPYSVTWFLSGVKEQLENAIQLDPRSPLGALADLRSGAEGWNPPVAVALSLQRRAAPELPVAYGVTLLPSGAFSALMQLLMAHAVVRVQMRPAYATEEDVERGSFEDFTIASAEFTCYGDGNRTVVSFRPFLLRRCHWDRVNAVRRLLGPVLLGDSPGGPALRQEVDALLAELYGDAGRADAETLAEAERWAWFSVDNGLPSRQGGPRLYLPGELLPQLTIGEEWEVLSPEGQMKSRVQFDASLRDEAWYNKTKVEIRKVLRLNPNGAGQDVFMKVGLFSDRSSRQKRLMLGFKTVRNLLESMPDLVVIQPSLEDKYGWKAVPAPGALEAEEPEPPKERKTYLPLSKEMAERLVQTVQPEAWGPEQRRAYFRLFQNVAAAIAQHDRGVLLSNFQLVAGLAGAEAKAEWRALGFPSVKALLRSLSNVVYLQAIRNHPTDRYVVYPAHLIPATSRLRYAWWTGRNRLRVFADLLQAEQENHHSATLAPDDADRPRDSPEDPPEHNPETIPQTAPPAEAKVEEADAEAPTTALTLRSDSLAVVDARLLIRVAEGLWSTGQSRQYLSVRARVKEAIRQFPDGMDYPLLTRLPRLSRAILHECKRVLKFPTVWDLLLTMHDIISLQLGKKPGMWSIYPPQRVNWDGSPRLPHPLKVMTARDLGCTVPEWAYTILPPMPGQGGLGRRGIHPEYINLRTLVARHIQDYPGGVSLRRFRVVTGLGTSECKRVRAAIGCKHLVPFLESMPDLITVVPDPDNPGHSHLVYPAGVEIPGWPPAPPPPAPAPVSTEPSHWASFVAPKPRGPEEDWRTIEEETAEVEAGRVELPDIGALPPAAYLWTKRERGEYTNFRRYVSDLMLSRFPTGCRAIRLARDRGLSRPRARRRRMLLGYYTTWELLRSMPDIVRLDDSDPEKRRWWAWPGGYVPTPEDEEKRAKRLPTNSSRRLGLGRGGAPKDPEVGEPVDVNEEAVEVRTAAERLYARMGGSTTDEQLQRWLKRRPQHIPVQWVVFRDVVEATILQFPLGTDLMTFGIAAGFGLRGWRRRQRAVGCAKLSEMLRRMPDLVRLEPDPWEPKKTMVRPARPGATELSPEAAARLKLVDRNRLRTWLKLSATLLTKPSYDEFTQVVSEQISALYPDGVPASSPAPLRSADPNGAGAAEAVAPGLEAAPPVPPPVAAPGGAGEPDPDSPEADRDAAVPVDVPIESWAASRLAPEPPRPQMDSPSALRRRRDAPTQHCACPCHAVGHAGPRGPGGVPAAPLPTGPPVGARWGAESRCVVS